MVAFWAILEKRPDFSKNCLDYILEQLMEKIGLIFVPTSGHTVWSAKHTLSQRRWTSRRSIWGVKLKLTKMVK